MVESFRGGKRPNATYSVLNGGKVEVSSDSGMWWAYSWRQERANGVSRELRFRAARSCLLNRAIEEKFQNDCGGAR